MSLVLGGTPISDVAGNFDTLTTSSSFAVDLSAPTLDLNGPATGTSFGSVWDDTGPVAVADPAAALLADSDSATLVSLAATIVGPQPGDVLSASVAGTNITSSFSSGVLSLSGADTVADYQQVLRTIEYDNSLGNPNTNAVTVNLVANDGLFNSNTAVTTVTINAVK